MHPNLTRGSMKAKLDMSESFRCVFTPQNILFLAQILCILITVCVALLNLTLNRGSRDDHLWSAVLSSSLAFMMPSPKLKLNKDNNTTELTEVKAKDSPAK